MLGLVTVHPVVIGRTQSESSQAVLVSTPDDVTFLKLMVASLVPYKKQSGNPVEHSSEGHNGPDWKLEALFTKPSWISLDRNYFFQRRHREC